MAELYEHYDHDRSIDVRIGQDCTQEPGPLLYLRLRALARSYMRRERGYHTLQPTALVHEAYLRLAGSTGLECNGKTHFYALAATQMRRILIEHARAANRQKRGAGRKRMTLHDDLVLTRERSIDLLALDEALSNLSSRNPRQGRVAELRLFAGLLVEETARVLQVSERTVKNDWKFARAWLARALLSSGRNSS